MQIDYILWLFVTLSILVLIANYFQKQRLVFLLSLLLLFVGYYQSKEADVKIAASNAVAQTAKADAATATLKSQNAIKELDSSKQVIRNLENKMAPRSLTNEQAQKLTKNFSNLFNRTEPGLALILVTKFMDDESLSYGKQIKNAIEKAGVPVIFSTTSTHSFRGISIFHNPDSKDSANLKEVQKAFIDASINFNNTYQVVTKTAVQYKPAVYIIIGRK